VQQPASQCLCYCGNSVVSTQLGIRSIRTLQFVCTATSLFSKAVLGERCPGFHKGRAVIKGQSASLTDPFGLVEEMFR